jgi:hypothetical protein
MDCQFPRCPRVSLEKPVRAELGASAVEPRIAGRNPGLKSKTESVQSKEWVVTQTAVAILRAIAPTANKIADMISERFQQILRILRLLPLSSHTSSCITPPHANTQG